MTRLFEVQSSIFQRLSNDTELKLVSNGVYDSIPDSENFPYVVLGRVFSTPIKTKTTHGETVEVTIDIWSASKGKKETIQIIKHIESSLEDDLSIQGAFLLSQDVKSREVLEEVNDLYHGTLVLEIKLDME